MKKNFFNLYYNFVVNQLKNYEIIYITSDLRGFLLKYYPMNPSKLCDMIINILLKEKKTIVIPAYTYTDKGIFNVKNSLTNLSYLSKWCMKKNFYRTYHPIFSVFVIGKYYKDFKDIGRSAHGKKSFWNIMLKRESSLFHIGRPFSLGNTFIHYVEACMKAKYRFNKIFKTKVFDGAKYIGTNFSAYVRKNKFKLKHETDPSKIAKLIKLESFYKNIGDEKKFLNFTHIDLKKSFFFMCKEFKKNNTIFLK